MRDQNSRTKARRRRFSRLPGSERWLFFASSGERNRSTGMSVTIPETECLFQNFGIDAVDRSHRVALHSIQSSWSCNAHLCSFDLDGFELKVIECDLGSEASDDIDEEITIRWSIPDRRIVAREI